MSQYAADVSTISKLSIRWTTRYVGFSAFTILIWDHIITFPDEARCSPFQISPAANVKYMWKGRKTPLCTQRTHDADTDPNQFEAYTLQSWEQDTCERYIRYEGIMMTIGIGSVSLMMLIRVYALYNTFRWVTGSVAFILFVETVMNVYLMVYARACSMILNGSHFAASASVWLPLIYVTIVFKLFLFKTLQTLGSSDPEYLVRRMFQDGLVYYVLICAVNLTLDVMLIATSVGIQNIAAQFKLLSHHDDLKSRFSLTNLKISMMSRITLNLKQRAHDGRYDYNQRDEYDEYVEDDDEEEDDEDVKIRRRHQSFSSVRSRGKRPNTQSLSSPALATIYSEPASGIQTPEGQDVHLPSDLHAAELREILELRRLDPMAGRQNQHTASGVDF
ncbi:hypothetical protein FIBSPDRAFT_899190 [Athelia psychrophila]|uniref:DUF6533 domain-containing protein n=1 Tax=Athelia psychrophila TaxID=1759441 RepID=A0A166A2M0_9AGAM|nr:hypothetical protein FIBSPDRAFT_899190 [Fibularhizoctonia sp. CBS 109695]